MDYYIVQIPLSRSKSDNYLEEAISTSSKWTLLNGSIDVKSYGPSASTGTKKIIQCLKSSEPMQKLLELDSRSTLQSPMSPFFSEQTPAPISINISWVTMLTPLDLRKMINLNEYRPRPLVFFLADHPCSLVG